MSYSILDVEDAMIQALAKIPYIQTLETFEGEIEDVVKDIKSFPAILIDFKNSENEFDAWDGEVPVTMWRILNFDVHVITRSLRSKSAARRKKETGAYALIEDVEGKLLGKIISLDDVEMAGTNPFESTGAEQVLVVKNVACYRIPFSIRYLKEVNHG